MIIQIPNYSPSIVTSTSRPKIRHTDDGRHDDVFWRIYDEIESASDKKTVSGQELKARLVSSNKFFVGDAMHAFGLIKGKWPLPSSSILFYLKHGSYIDKLSFPKL